MKYKNLIAAAVIFISAGFLLGTSITLLLNKNGDTLQSSPIDTNKLQPAINLSESFVEISNHSRPAVVYIFTEKTILRRSINPFVDDFFSNYLGEDYLEKFYGIPKEYKKGSLGTGFIIRKDGIIITNAHIIEGADKIKVKLDNDEIYDAKLLGIDNTTDIAVLKINNAKDFPYLKMGNSDNLRVGEWVIAIGNPFGLSKTVTAGIVSAMGRGNITNTEFEDYIQTDASINPGNSGGPLINIKGEIIGINTAIYSPTGSGVNIGIGFAIPINLAKRVINDILDDGIIDRGWLGIYVQNLTPEISDKKGAGNTKGVLITEIKKNSPAEKYGLKAGDIIIHFDNKKIENHIDLRNAIARTPVNKDVSVDIIRESKPKTIILSLARRFQIESSKRSLIDNIGIRVAELTLKQKRMYNVKYGVIVLNLDKDKQGFLSGVQKGDIIIEVNRKPVKNVKIFIEILSQTLDNEPLLFTILRKNEVIYRYIKQ